jgi:hypothetical protein
LEGVEMILKDGAVAYKYEARVPGQTEISVKGFALPEDIIDITDSLTQEFYEVQVEPLDEMPEDLKS